jgi:hypothetical protein
MIPIRIVCDMQPGVFILQKNFLKNKTKLNVDLSKMQSLTYSAIFPTSSTSASNVSKSAGLHSSSSDETRDRQPRLSGDPLQSLLRKSFNARKKLSKLRTPEKKYQSINQSINQSISQSVNQSLT